MQATTHNFLQRNSKTVSFYTQAKTCYNSYTQTKQRATTMQTKLIYLGVYGTQDYETALAEVIADVEQANRDCNAELYYVKMIDGKSYGKRLVGLHFAQHDTNLHGYAKLVKVQYNRAGKEIVTLQNTAFN